MIPLKPLSFLIVIFAASIAPCLAARADGKIHITYWEKWSGAEEDAMQEVVNQFNRSQDHIVVDFLSVGDIDRKTIMATAGGDPPDIAGLIVTNIYSFADRNALTPLDDFMREDGSTPDQFLSRYAKAYSSMVSYHDKVWAVPSTPATVALYWNKKLFAEAGLDPEKPPQTIAEMNAMSAKLTRRDSAGNLVQVGFLPQASAGWVWAFPCWFGGGLFDGKDITIGTNPANLTAFRWMADFSHEYGVDSLRRLTSSFGTLSTPQDPFMNRQVAMIIDGVYRSHFIHQFAPGLKYGVANWPEAQPGVSDFTVAEADMLAIPRGAKHPREAWAFMKYVSSPNLSAQREEDLSGVELLCFLQEKGSPLSQWSPYFTAHNPNPDLDVFRKLGDSPHALVPPKIGVWDQYQRELNTAFDKVRLQIDSPEDALNNCQARMDNSWKWECESLALRQKQTTPETAGNSVSP